MRVLLSPYGSYGSHGSRESRESRGDVEPMVGLAVQLRALQARGAAMPVCAPPDFTHRLARVGVPLALMVPVGQSVHPLVTRVTGTTPPSAADLPRRAAVLVATQLDTVAAAAEGCDALVPAMPAGGWL